MAADGWPRIRDPQRHQSRQGNSRAEPEGGRPARQFEQLVRTADVVVEGFRPGVLDKLGVGYARWRSESANRAVQHLGLWSDRALQSAGGHDLGYQAVAGALSLAGGDTPDNPPLQVADTAAGSYAAAMLILAALIECRQTGRGRHLDVSMSEQLPPLMTAQYAAADAQGCDPQRVASC